MALTETQLDQIAEGVAALGLPSEPLRPLRLRNLSHEHVRVADHSVLRMPITLPSELHWTDWADFQAEAYGTLSRFGLSPQFYASFDSSQALPHGGALVEYIKGRLPRLPKDFPAFARFLGKMHQLPVPLEEMRGLPTHSEPLMNVTQQIFDQAVHLNDAPITDNTRKILESELTWLESFARTGWVRMGAPPFGLSIGRSHPGDFVITDAGEAVLVDVENLHYGLNVLDLGALSIYPATVWDMSIQSELAEIDVLEFHRHYLDTFPSQTRAHIVPWLQVGRRIATLRLLTWCCLWLIRHRRPGDRWAADKRPPGITAHMVTQAQHFVSEGVVNALRSEWMRRDGLCAQINRL
ncbi:MAG: phosphotransferase [Alphaproteobacteria bacterium]